MKILLTTILFGFLSTFLFGQNWNILNPDVTSYYSHSDSIHLTNTINIDSTIVNGVSETSYISNKYKVCDTCDFNPENEVIIYRYAKEFLGFGVEFNTEDDYYVIEGDSLFYQSEIGDTWQFNGELTAITTSIYVDSVIGELDSLKMITLSSNDTIILSKNHGIIRYPDFDNQGKYYELKGYHNDEWYYGEVFPNFWSIYDFAVGDEYCGYSNSGYINFSDMTKQIKILSLLSVSEDGFVYETTARGTNYYGAVAIGESNGWAETSYFNNNNSTETFTHFLDQYEDYFGINPSTCLVENTQDETPYFSGSYLFCFGWSGYVVSENDFVNEYGYQKTLRLYTLLGDSLLYFNYENQQQHEEISYANHFGRTFRSDIALLDFGSSEGLHGAIINGNTIGDFCDFPIDLSIKNVSINPLSIRPNRATSHITIEGNYNSIEIFSQTGQSVLKLEKPTSIIDVSNLSSGIYFLKATNEEKLYTTKLIVE